MWRGLRSEQTGRVIADYSQRSWIRSPFRAGSTAATRSASACSPSRTSTPAAPRPVAPTVRDRRRGHGRGRTAAATRTRLRLPQPTAAPTRAGRARDRIRRSGRRPAAGRSPVAGGPARVAATGRAIRTGGAAPGRAAVRSPASGVGLGTHDRRATAAGRHRRDRSRRSALVGGASALAQYFGELDDRFRSGSIRMTAAPIRAAALRPPDGAFLVMFSDQTPSGAAGCSASTSTPVRSSGCGFIPTGAGSGSAAGCLHRLEAVARELGHTRMVLDTNETLIEAITMYKRAGYHPSSGTTTTRTRSTGSPRTCSTTR